MSSSTNPVSDWDGDLVNQLVGEAPAKDMTGMGVYPGDEVVFSSPGAQGEDMTAAPGYGLFRGEVLRVSDGLAEIRPYKSDTGAMVIRMTVNLVVINSSDRSERNEHGTA